MLSGLWLVLNQVRGGLLWCAAVASHNEVAGLLQSAAWKLDDGVRSILGAPPPRVVDEARFLMEIEFLLRDFALDPRRIDEWTSLDLWERNNKYGFGKSRRRVETALGLPDGQSLPDKVEYSIHSAEVHPQPAHQKHPEATTTEQRQALLDADLSDLAIHGWRVLTAFCGNADRFVTEDPEEDIELSLDLSGVREFVANRNETLVELGFPVRSASIDIMEGPEGVAAKLADQVRRLQASGPN
ncbi:MAG: hypothetical protein JWR52_1066 [Marmoricola sp.]|nr:hypothetical protein [Marmoricola sp.]